MSKTKNPSHGNTMDMTVGDPVRLLLVFSLPMLLGNLFQQVYSLVDSIVVGKTVGSEALGSIGATSSVCFLFFALCNGIGGGGGIIISQFFGAKDEEKVRSAMANAAYIMLLVSCIVCIFSYLGAEWILTVMKTTPEQYADAVIYLKIQCLGLPLVAVYNYSASVLRALGDSRGPLYILIFSCILNTGLDLLFVIVFGMGVMGAGVATVLSQLISGIGCLIYAYVTSDYFHLKREDLRFNRSIAWRCISLGVPLSVQFSLIAISCMGMQVVVNTFGPVTVSAFTATGRIEQLVHQPYGSLGTALATYSGQNKGAIKNSRIREGLRKSMWMMAGFTVLLFLVMQLGGEAIVRLFVDEQEVIDMGAKALRITSLFYLSLGVIYMTRGVLNGVGDALFALINGVVEVLSRIALPILLTGIAALGVWGIWWAAGLIWVVSGFFCVLRYLTWRRKNPLEAE